MGKLLARFFECNLTRSSNLSMKTCVSTPPAVRAYCVDNIDVNAAAIALICKCVVSCRRSLVKPV